jgi:hypothetical protein
LIRPLPVLLADQAIQQNTAARLDGSKSKTNGKKYPMVIIMWTFTMIMIVQREIGLVSSNTIRLLTLILKVITLIVVLVSLIQRWRAPWHAGVSQWFWRAKPTTTSRVSEIGY